MSTFRLYEPHECTGRDGYPPVWHETLKHAVREAAGHRCVRCLHPYEKGAGEWSPCDDLCMHGAPVRMALPEGGWAYRDDSIFLDNGDDYEHAGSVAAEGWHIEARYRVLTVHHLDGKKANCRWWNLVALCQRCHLQIQGRVRMERVWPWEHSDWFKPYVAGYYAWSYLGLELDRQQVEARLEELLGLERQVA